MRRTEQRRAAVWALYQSDLLARPLEETFPGDVHGFTRELAQLVRDHQPELDELIRRHATGWSLERIAPLERSILRVGLAELLYRGRAPRRARDPAGGRDRRGGRDGQAVLRQRGAGVHQRDPRRGAQRG